MEGVIKNLGRGSCTILRNTSVKKWRIINSFMFKLRRLIARHKRILIKNKIQAPSQNLPLMIPKFFTSDSPSKAFHSFQYIRRVHYLNSLDYNNGAVIKFQMFKVLLCYRKFRKFIQMVFFFKLFTL